MLYVCVPVSRSPRRSSGVCCVSDNANSLTLYMRFGGVRCLKSPYFTVKNVEAFHIILSRFYGVPVINVPKQEKYMPPTTPSFTIYNGIPGV